MPHGHGITLQIVRARKHDGAVATEYVSPDIDDNARTPALHADELNRPETFHGEFHLTVAKLRVASYQTSPWM